MQKRYESFYLFQFSNDKCVLCFLKIPLSDIFRDILEIAMWLSLKPVFIVLIKQIIFLDDFAKILRFLYYLT